MKQDFFMPITACNGTFSRNLSSLQLATIRCKLLLGLCSLQWYIFQEFIVVAACNDMLQAAFGSVQLAMVDFQEFIVVAACNGAAQVDL
jgi:hypothetical protein